MRGESVSFCEGGEGGEEGGGGRSGEEGEVKTTM